MLESRTLMMSNEDRPVEARVSTGERAERAAGEAKAADEAKAARESQEANVSEPGGFDNDPDDSSNPNEVIERHRRKLRP